MLVNGVFKSWLTLVISSLFMRSARTSFCSAACMPSPSELIFSAISANTPSGMSVSLKPRSPARSRRSASTIRSKPVMRLMRK